LLDKKRAGKGGGGKGGDQPAGGQAPTAEPSTGQVPKAEPKAPNVEGKGTAPVRKLWEAITGPGQGPPVTDDNARRFFDEIPADLTEEQVNALITRLGPVGEESFDEVLDQLKKGIANLRKGPDAPDAEGGAEPEDTSLGAGTEGAGEADPDLIKKLAAEAAKIDPKRYRRGQVRLMWSEEKDDVFEGTVQGRSAAGRAVAGRVKAHIEKRLPEGKLAVKYLSTTPVVDSAGNIVLTAAQFADLNKTLTVIAGRKTK
jgi:hypothetical protein